MIVILTDKIRRIKELEFSIHKYEMQKVASRVAKKDMYKGNIHLLMLVERCEGLSQAEISKHIHVRPATTTVMLKRAEKAGLIKRLNDEKDLRTTRVYLTEDGKVMANKMKDMFIEITLNMYSYLTDDELDVYHNLLSKIYNGIKTN